MSDRCEICGWAYDPTIRRPPGSPNAMYANACQHCYDAFNVVPVDAVRALGTALYLRMRAQRADVRREIDELRAEIAALKGGKP